MKTIGDKLEAFKLVGVNPGSDKFFDITEESFPGMWKVIVFYPKDFTFVCPTEIVAYDRLYNDFKDREAVLLTGSTDNEHCKLAWQKHHPDLARLSHIQFADTQRGRWVADKYVNLNLAEQLGVIDYNEGVALRATFIVDPWNVVQHVSVNNLNVGRNPDETLRILDGLQTDELCPCNRQVGGATL